MQTTTEYALQCFATSSVLMYIIARITVTVLVKFPSAPTGGESETRMRAGVGRLATMQL